MNQIIITFSKSTFCPLQHVRKKKKINGEIYAENLYFNKADIFCEGKDSLERDTTSNTISFPGALSLLPHFMSLCLQLQRLRRLQLEPKLTGDEPGVYKESGGGLEIVPLRMTTPTQPTMRHDVSLCSLRLNDCRGS